MKATRVLVDGYFNDERDDFDRLFDLAQTVRTTAGDLWFDFTGCQFLAQNAIAIIGALWVMVQEKGKQVYYSFENMNPRVRSHL